MPKTNSFNHHRFWVVVVIVMAFADFVLLLRYLMHGKNIALFNPTGVIATEQHKLIMFTGAILLLIGIPAVLLLYFTAWKYRESNQKAVYSPTLQYGKRFKIGVWAVPAVFMILLAAVMYPSTHRLDPRKNIAADTDTMTIQVIALRWKWLFLYPEQGVASINFAQIPVNTPVQFEITADESPMSSFWIPNLGGQLYSMTSHVNRLNLMATSMGDFPGSSAEINGAGFSGMRFTARSGSQSDFEEWVQTAKQSIDVLDEDTYKAVLAPSEDNPVAVYSSYEHDLYDTVVAKYLGPDGGHSHHE